MISMNITGRDGALTTFRIVGGAAFKDQAPSFGYCLSTNGNDLTGKASKDGIAKLRAWVESTKAEAAGLYETPAANERTIVLAASNLPNCGRAWVCTGRDVDRHSLPPEWEGLLICYCYCYGA